MAVYTVDNFLDEADFNDYLERLEFAKFGPVTTQGVTYPDISQNISGDKLYNQISTRYPQLKPDNIVNFLRAYKKRQEPNPTWIHSDASFAEYIAIFMVQPSESPQDDGVCFWEHKGIEDYMYDTTLVDVIDDINKDSTDPEKWDIWKRVEFKPNRLVLAPANYFHSKATYTNIGTTYKSCRIVHVLFFNKGKVDV